MATPTQPRAADAAAPMSSLARIFGVFAAPGRTFAEIARDPHFILCWCIQIVVGLGYALLMLDKVGAYAMMRQSLMQSSRGRNLSPEQLQATLNSGAKVTAIFTYFSPLISILFLLFIAVIFLGISNLLLGQEARFKQVLAMVSHAYLTLTLFALIAMTVLVLMADPSTYAVANPIGTNLGFFLDKSTTSAFLYALGTRLDLFSLWTVGLLSLGLAKLGGRKGKFGSALGVTLALWLFYCLAVAGIAGMFA